MDLANLNGLFCHWELHGDNVDNPISIAVVNFFCIRESSALELLLEEDEADEEEGSLTDEFFVDLSFGIEESFVMPIISDCSSLSNIFFCRMYNDDMASTFREEGTDDSQLVSTEPRQ